MRQSMIFSVLLFALISFALAVDSRAEETSPIQIALFNPVQIFDESIGIEGVRLNLLYGRNVFVRGLDVGLVNVCGAGESVGCQWGIAGYVQGDFTGIQINSFNITEQEFSGLQWGIFNNAGNGEGVQLGFLNTATNMRGLQFGFANYTETMYGIQIGLVNIIRQKETLPVFVFFNWSF